MRRGENFNISLRVWKIILLEEDINCELDNITEHEFNDDVAIFSNIAKWNFFKKNYITKQGFLEYIFL